MTATAGATTFVLGDDGQVADLLAGILAGEDELQAGAGPLELERARLEREARRRADLNTGRSGVCGRSGARKRDARSERQKPAAVIRNSEAGDGLVRSMMRLVSPMRAR